jgi:hypothetical protein
MRGTTKALVTLALGATLVARPVAAQETSPGEEFGLAVGAAAANLLYTPAKVVVALGGLVVGSLTGLLTGGDVRAAYGVWVPAASGTYVLRPSNLDGTEPVEFFGSDYADTPSTALEAESGGIYDAQYSM